jgi:hypothetical protein
VKHSVENCTTKCKVILELEREGEGERRREREKGEREKCFHLVFCFKVFKIKMKI